VPTEGDRSAAAPLVPLDRSVGDGWPLPLVLGADDWDLFISYSRKDQAFASRLHAALISYQAPSGLPLPQRRLRVFLDVSDFAGQEYKPSIRRHLARSAKILVICSPNAVASRFVGPEIDDFVVLHPLPSPATGETPSRGDIVAVMIDGLPFNETSGPSDPRNAFPEALCRALDLPIAIDYRSFDQRRNKLKEGEYHNSWFTLLAQIYGHSRAALEERERKRRSRILRIRSSIAGAVGVGLILLSVWALWERHTAIAQRNRATAGRLAAQANLLLAEPRTAGRLPALLAIHALTYGDASEAQRALAASLRRLPPEPIDDVPGLIADAARMGDLWSSPSGRYAAVTAAYGVRGEIWDVPARRPVLSIEASHPDPPVVRIRFSPDERFFAIERGGGDEAILSIGELPSGHLLAEHRADRVQLAGADRWSVLTLDWERQRFMQQEIGSAAPILELPMGEEASLPALSADGHCIAVAGPSVLTVYESPSGKILNQFDLSAQPRDLSVTSIGPTIAMVQASGRLTVWTSDGRPTVLGEGYVGAEFTSDGHYLMAAGKGAVTMFDPVSGQKVIDDRVAEDAGAVLARIQSASDRNKVVDIQIAHDGSRLAIGRSAGDITLWQKGFVQSFGQFGMPMGLANVASLDHGTALIELRASDDLGRLLSRGSGYGVTPAGTMILDSVTVRIWDTGDRAEIARIVGKVGPSALSSEGDVVTTMEQMPGPQWNQPSFHVQRWRLPRPLQRVLPPGMLPVNASADGSVLLLLTSDGKLQLRIGDEAPRDIGSADRPPALRDRPAQPEIEDDEPDSSVGARAPDSNPPLPNARVLLPLPASVTANSLSAAGVTADGALLYRASPTSLELSPIGSGETSVVILDRPMSALALSRGGRFMATTSFPFNLRRGLAAGNQPGFVTDVRRLPDGAVWGSFAQRTPGSVVAISDDGRYLVTTALEHIPERDGHKPPGVMTVIFGIEGELVQEVWEWRTGRMVTRRKAATILRAPGFSPDSRHVVLDIGTGTAVVVSTEDGREVAEIVLSGSPAGPVDAVKAATPGMPLAFSTDGKRLLIARMPPQELPATMTIESTPWRPADLVALACARLPAEARELDADERLRYLPEDDTTTACTGGAQ
jgi:hypothetical protein